MSLPNRNVNEDFMDIFYHLIEDESININECRMNLFCLRVNNNNFNYGDFVDYLSDAIISYCISNKEYDEMYMKRQLGQMNKKAKKKFRDYATNKGELGEVILYSFLESHLRAPKILSKMKMKSSSNDYVKRSDGIHMLKIDDENFELILGESKMYGDLTAGIRDALTSIQELKYRENNNVDDEIELICSNIESEFCEENYEFIKRIIKPSRNDYFEFDISFGIFVGFEVDINIYSNMNNRQAREQIKIDIKNQIMSKINYINTKIREFRLGGHNIYLYFVPFDNIDERRKEILQELTK